MLVVIHAVLVVSAIVGHGVHIDLGGAHTYSLVRKVYLIARQRL